MPRLARAPRLAHERRAAAHPVPLTSYDPAHPYIVAMYDTGGRPRRRDEQVARPPGKFGDRPVIGSRA